MNRKATDSRVPLTIRARLVNFSGKQWPRFLFLGAIGFLVRTPAIQGPFIWDDTYLARDNPFIKSPLLILEVFRHYLFMDSLSGHYRPVQNLSFMVDYFFWNTDAAGFHMGNIFLHVTAGLLLYRLLTILFRTGLWPADDAHLVRTGALTAFLISALWMVHPVHSAAIDYVSGRADSLAFLFSAGAWLLVIRGRAAESMLDEICLLLPGCVLSVVSALLARDRVYLDLHFSRAYAGLRQRHHQENESRNCALLCVCAWCVCGIASSAGFPPE